jgi:hypothetical protein
MSKSSKCQNDFVPLLKSNGLPYKICDRCKYTDKKYKNKHKELAKFINEYRKNSIEKEKAIVYLAPANEENNLNDNSGRDMIGNDNKIDSK